MMVVPGVNFVRL